MFERWIEKSLFASRWILAPIYLGLTIAMLAVGVKFFQEAFHVLFHVWTMAEADMVLAVLAMIDMVLVASLVVMVMLSGYENFVSQIDLADEGKKLDWLGKLDATALKLKVAASIVAISSIHLLQIFMNAQQTPNDKILWYVVLHMTFVISSVLMAVMDRIGHRNH
ncbi:MAG: TIGR00645 family protein [Chromatiaceae bacterium]|nr:TIGR00645 family protein [Chromatiaceae bacterium]